MLKRVEDFRAGRWSALLQAARATGVSSSGSRPPEDAASRAVRARERACAQVRRGELSRARQTLTGAPLAPGNEETLRQLRDPARRPPELRRQLPDGIHSFRPEHPVQLPPGMVADALRSAKRGSAAGATAEHYKLLLEDEEALALFTQTASLLASADAPDSVWAALSLSRLTALAKPQGGVRGIATGDALRRLVSRALARQFADVFDRATRPYQFALQARAGTDCLAAMLRAAVELDGSATVISLDGRSAYDTVSRAAFLGKLREVAPSLVPFVRAFYGRDSRYLWWDSEGTRHDVPQGEGCEQGDPLAPALYALGQHDALVAAASRLADGDFLAAFLDDLYVVTSPERAREGYDVVTGLVEERAGVAANQGKTRVFNLTGGPAPPGIAELGPDVWCGSGMAEGRGFTALGTPIGSAEYVARGTLQRLESERALLDELPLLPDLQTAWLLLLFCASPRAQHVLRTVPPEQSAAYASAHEDAVWHTLQRLLGEPGAVTPEWAAAREVAFLPASMGGLGLLRATRVSPAAYWAAWADALPVMRQRRPEAAARCARELSVGDEAAAPSLRAAALAGEALDGAGWAGRPGWAELAGRRPPRPTTAIRRSGRTR